MGENRRYKTVIVGFNIDVELCERKVEVDVTDMTPPYDDDVITQLVEEQLIEVGEDQLLKDADPVLFRDTITGWVYAE